MSINDRRHLPPLTLTQEYIQIFLAVSFYWIISILTVFVNKTLLSAQEDFDAPMFVTWFQCVVTFIAIGILKIIGYYWGFGLIHFGRMRLKLSSLILVLPLSLVFVGMVAFNNLCLKFVGVSFYYLARCLTTVTNVIFTFTILHKSVSKNALVCCGVITLGYFLGIDQEGLTGVISWKGIIYGILSSCFVSLNSIYTKKMLPVVEDDIWALGFYNNINASILFIPIMFLIGELPNHIFVIQMLEVEFWSLMVFGGFCGLLIGVATAWQIQVTSPLTHNISGTAKACVQTLLAVYKYNDVKSVFWWMSNFIVLGGSVAYAKIQQLDMSATHKSNKSNDELTKPLTGKSGSDV